MKLHLGCGNIKLEGYINVDIRKTPATDMVHDCARELPFKDEEVDEIYAVQLIEHFSAKKPYIDTYLEIFKGKVPF